MRKHLLLAVAALVVGGKAAAEELSFSYLQADLLGGQLLYDDDDAYYNYGHKEGFGFGIHASAGLGPNLFGFLDVTSPKYKDFGLRLTSSALGLGAHLPIIAGLDVHAGASFERLKLSVSGYDDSASFDGWGLTVGARGAFHRNWEWDGALKYSDIDEAQSIIGFTAGIRRYFTPNFALGVGIIGHLYDKDTLDFIESLYSLNFRFDFNSRKD